VLPPSHLIWHGISSAVDHLDAFMGALDGGKSHPLAPSTLARSGILGSTHALCLLDGPDRDERRRRGLHLAHEEFKREKQMFEAIERIEAEQPLRVISGWSRAVLPAAAAVSARPHRHSGRAGGPRRTAAR
jgi:hypothetical protein